MKTIQVGYSNTVTLGSAFTKGVRARIAQKAPAIRCFRPDPSARVRNCMAEWGLKLRLRYGLLRRCVPGWHTG
ncbi:hypothetical protein BH23GEM3_BH23GEM3_23330 [soil metagenome]